jgi:hypothetical protein
MVLKTSDSLHYGGNVPAHEPGTAPEVCVTCAASEHEKEVAKHAEALAALLDESDTERCRYQPCPDEPTRLSRIVDYAAASTSVFTTFAVIYLLWENVTNGG